MPSAGGYVVPVRQRLAPPPTPAPGARMVFLSEDIKPDSPFAAVLILTKDFLLAISRHLYLEVVVTLLCIKFKPERRDHAAFDNRAIGIDVFTVEKRLNASARAKGARHPARAVAPELKRDPSVYARVLSNRNLIYYSTVQPDECPDRTARPERPFPDGPAAARLN